MWYERLLCVAVAELVVSSTIEWFHFSILLVFDEYSNVARPTPRSTWYFDERPCFVSRRARGL
jgi:hypothetical protein